MLILNAKQTYAPHLILYSLLYLTLSLKYNNIDKLINKLTQTKGEYYMEKIYILCVNRKGKLETFYINLLERSGIKIKESDVESSLASFLNIIGISNRKGIVFHRNSFLKNSSTDNIIFIDVLEIHPKDILKKIENLIKNKTINFQIPEKILKFYQNNLPQMIGHDFLRNRCSRSRPAF